MLRFKTLNIILFALVSAHTLNAQKLKYKDIYGLLSTKQYEQAEPFLKTYIKENDDNPNAYLFMGLIYQEKALNTDVLIQTETALQQMDTAVIYLSKATQMMTEKEIRKNKEYYTAYNRRDLRTGEFGVKLSDVQLDLENRINSNRERIDKVKMVKFYFTKAEDLYSRSYDLFLEIQKQYPGERELYLRSDEEMLKKISDLSTRFDSCSKMFENYKVSLSNLGKTKYNQNWNLQEINNFKSDGSERADFYKDEVKVWDYKKFATKTLAVIEKEVIPTLDDLVKYDIEINKLRLRMENDSISVKNDLVKLIDRLLNNQLKKFDPDPMPMDVFALKIADLDYKSTVLENRSVKKSEDLNAILNAAKQEEDYLAKLDSVSGKLSKRSIDEDILNYKRFITSTFSKGEILKSYVRSIREYVEREMSAKEKEVASYTESLKWIVVNNDSIPLTSESVVSKFKPLLVEQNKYTVGAQLVGSTGSTGYFYNIPLSHVPTIKATFALDTGLVRPAIASSLNAKATSDDGGQIFFVVIHSTVPSNSKFAATVAKVYKSDGLSWNTNIRLDFVPSKIEFLQETGELLIKSDSDLITSIDKNGKLIPK